MTKTKKFPTRAEWDAFNSAQAARFNIAAQLIRMKQAAQTVIKENPAIVTKTATSSGGKLPEITTLAHLVLDHHDHVGSCIERAGTAADADAAADAAAAAAAQAIQLDRAYHALIQYRLRPATLYGVDHLFLWQGEWIDVTVKGRQILACIGERVHVPRRELLEATGANLGTVAAQLSRLNKSLRPLGYVLQLREEFVNVTYTGV